MTQAYNATEIDINAIENPPRINRNTTQAIKVQAQLNEI
jgi:hypothetical protein